MCDFCLKINKTNLTHAQNVIIFDKYENQGMYWSI